MRIPMDRQICLPYQRRVLNGVICIADPLKGPQIVFVLTANPYSWFHTNGILLLYPYFY